MIYDLTAKPSIRLLKDEIHNLSRIVVDKKLENIELKQPEMHRLEFHFTDGFRTGIIFNKLTPKRDVVDFLRKAANAIEDTY